MKRAVFLDRDGTVIQDVPYLSKPSQLRLLPGVARAVRELNRLGFLVIILTNQAIVARGMLTEEGLKEIHEELIRRLKKKGAIIDAIYYCPHHPEEGEERYRKKCRCRKPEVGLMKKAARDFRLDLKHCIVIGDMTSDIEMGRRAGVTTILVRTGHGGKDGRFDTKPDYMAENLKEVVRIIKKI